MINESPALLAFSDDIKDRGFLDWLESHASLMPPFHRYKGTIKLDYDCLDFYGTDRKTGNEFFFRLQKYEIEELFLGFDKVYSIWETRNFGLAWKPLRITFKKDDSLYQLYFIINYFSGRTDNEQWLENLKEWLS